MKRLILFLLLCSLIISPTKSFATEFNEDEVLKLKEKFKISDDFSKFDLTKYNNSKGIEIKNYSWSKDDNNFITISIDSKDNVINYDISKPNNKNNISITSKDDILNLSKDFLNTVDPNLNKMYKFENIRFDIKSSWATVSYNRIVNDIKVLNDKLTVVVNLADKSIEQFVRDEISAVLEDSKFPNPKKAVNKDEALDLVLKENPFVLGYVNPKQGKEKVAVPAYFQNSNNNTINALTKEFVNISNSNEYKKDEAASGGVNESYTPQLTRVESSELKKLSSLKKLEEAKNYAIKSFNTKDLNLESYSLDKFEEDETYAYNFYFTNNNQSANIAVDASDLNLISYYKYVSSNSESPKLSKDEIINLANKFVKAYNHYKNIDMQNYIYTEDTESTLIKYPRIENSYPVKDEGLQLRIQSNSNFVNQYNSYAPKSIFENIDTNKAISKEVLKKSFLDQYKFNLYYAYINNTPTLVYSTDSYEQPIIKYDTGVAINQNGSSVDINLGSYENLDSSSYKDEIEKLNELNINIPKNIDLKSPISTSDFIYLISLISGNEDYNPKAIRETLNQYMFEDLKKDELDKDIKTKDSVKWILNNLGYYNLKELKNVFDKDIFKDSKSIPDEYIAYYYLASALSIYDYEEAYPDSILTVEEAFHLIYNSIIKD